MDDISWEDIEAGSICKKDVETKKPERCGVCGKKTKRLRPHKVGKMNYYICKFCSQLIKKDGGTDELRQGDRTRT